MKKLFIFVILGIVIGFFLVVTPGLAKKFYITPVLEKVERTPAVEPNTGNSIENKVTFKDPLINITWPPDPKGFRFVVINVSASPLCDHPCPRFQGKPVYLYVSLQNRIGREVKKK
ncbi:MAG: hypothetical protein GY950_19000 [bacterium]|nr:hypothetical protein [bacterium]